MAAPWERELGGQNSCSRLWNSEETKSRGHSIDNKSLGPGLREATLWALGIDSGWDGLQTGQGGGCTCSC